jgi:hypothetical protein
VLLGLLSACGGDSPTTTHTAAAVTLEREHRDLQVRVAMAETLKGKFRIATAAALVPGRSNPKAAAVQVEGSWKSDTERGYGSERSTLNIAAGATAELRRHAR